jgi:hypothetical protein
MITPKIKALFQFIEYLHSNIVNFNLNNDLIKELEQLDEERQKVSSKKTYKDKLKYDEVQAEIETKFKILQGNTANLIKAKAKELNVCNFDNEPNYSFNGIETDIHQLKENFSKNDLPEIFKHKQQYIEYRRKTHKTFLSLAIFIEELDKVTKSLFDYFKETEQNEFEAFEKKTIEVNSIEEAIQIFTNKEHKDERFWLNSFFDEQEQTNLNYKSYKYQIDNNGYFIVNVDKDKVKIYTPELAVILTSNELSARNMETQTETTVNGRNYLNTYIEAYKEGEQYFETEFKVSPNTLYGANAEQYVKDIHLNFFHVQHTGANEGWCYVKKNYPIILTYKAIKEFGFYSGIVNKVEEQVKKYPRLFASFDKCEHNLPPTENLFSVLEWATIFYYADETKLLPENPTIKARIEQFINKYEIDTTIKYFRTQYYEAKKRINEKNDYPLNKLELIIPFLKENYKQTVTKVENDIIFLQENQPEY